MKKFVVHIRSESCDDYYIQFEAEKAPKTDKQWLSLLKKNEELSGEIDSILEEYPESDIMKHFLSIRKVIEIK